MRARRLRGNSFLGLALGADKENLAALCYSIGHLVVSIAKKLERLLQVNDVNTVSGAENVRFHLGIPAPCLMAEMHACFKHLFHCNVSHYASNGLCLHSVLYCPQPSKGTRGGTECAIWEDIIILNMKFCKTIYRAD